MTSLHSNVSDTETASRSHIWQRPAPPSLDTARRSVLLHKSTSTHALPELCTPPPSAAAAARAAMQQKIKAKLIAQKGIGTNTLKKRPEDSVSVHRRINQDVVDAAGAAMRASINQMFPTARLSASANAIRSALTRSLTMESHLPPAPIASFSSENVKSDSVSVSEVSTESNFALVPHQVASPARSPPKPVSHANTTPKPFALTPKAASPSRPTYTESCRPAPVLLYRPPSPPTLGRPAFRVSKGKLVSKREAQRLLAIVNAQAEEVAIRQQQHQLQLSIRPQTAKLHSVSTTESREATFSRLQRPKSALPSSSHHDKTATTDQSNVNSTKTTSKTNRIRPASASILNTPHTVEHARVLHHSPSLRNLTVPKLPLQDIAHNDDAVSQSSLSPASCSSDSSIEEEEFEVEIDIDVAPNAKSEFEQEPLSSPSGVQPIELPFDSAVLELAFQYMKHAQQCNSCPPLFALSATSNQSVRRAAECVCWSLPDTFATPQPVKAAVRTEIRKMTRAGYEAYLSHRQQVRETQAGSSMQWWTPAVQLVMCADYLDLPGLARIAGTRLATAFQTDAKFVEYLQSTGPHFALSFLPSLPADEFIDLIINYAPLSTAFVNQILPELESILRSVYLVNLARRHREREDQLEKMLLDLTAVETFPPLLANADKPDATTGKYWPEHCEIFRRFVSMLTQSKSTSAPPLSDEDLINFPVAVLHLFGANKAIDACLMSLLDRMHQLTTLNLHGCTSLTQETICAIIARTPLIQSASFPYVVNCGARALSEMGRSWPALELLDITSCAAIDDVALETFVTACSAQFGTDRHPLKYLNVANIGTITDRSLKCIGRYFALQDLCLYGCYRVTDNGVLDLRVDCLKRFNFSGCYKITSGCQRYLFTSNTNILFYNAPHQFGPAGVQKKQ